MLFQQLIIFEFSGATRKAYVCDYELTDPLDPKFKVVTSHLAIYTVEVWNLLLIRLLIEMQYDTTI